MKRQAVTIVIDGVGVGALPDAGRYGDEGANSLGSTARAVGGMRLATLESFGLGNIVPIEGVGPVRSTAASWGRMGARSPGKDSTTGHWELMGCPLAMPFPTHPNGFPREIIGPFEEMIGRAVLGNKPASGTAIIDELGEERMRTGRPIVYTSADSVFQIAAHEVVMPVRELYRICRAARKILEPPHHVARVIARPFVGSPGRFARTRRRAAAVSSARAKRSAISPQRSRSFSVSNECRAGVFSIRSNDNGITVKGGSRWTTLRSTG